MVVCNATVDGYHYVVWIADYFGDCIYTPKDIASFSIGLLSILIWIPAQMPQIIMNFRLGRVEAIHPLFLVNWALGDSTNLIGCLLTGQLATQVFTAVYYCAVDVLMLGQYAFYQCCRPKCCPKLDAKAKAAASAIAVTSLVGKASAAMTTLAFVASGTGSDGLIRASSSDPSALIGLVLGWVSASMYLLARLPQIIRNFQRSSVDGLSWKLFVFAVLGNTTYGLSIFLRSIEPRFLLDRLPWLVGSLGTLVFDATIISQFLYYTRVRRHGYLVVNSHDHDHDHDHDSDRGHDGHGAGHSDVEVHE